MVNSAMEQRQTVTLPFSCRVSVRWPPSLRTIGIVWRLKAMELSGHGDVFRKAVIATIDLTFVTTPFQVPDLSSAVGIAEGILRIVWRSKAMEPSGRGGRMIFGQLGDGSTTVQPLYSREIQGFVEHSEAPQWPEGDVLTVTDVTYNSVQLNWQPATDETGVDKYLVYQYNTLLATLNGDVNSYEVKGLSPNSSYLFSLVAVDADGNQSVKKEVTVTTAAYATPRPFQLSDSKTYSYGGSNYEFLLYYGYISSSGQELSGSWSPPEGFHGVVKVSMVPRKGKIMTLVWRPWARVTDCRKIRRYSQMVPSTVLPRCPVVTERSGELRDIRAMILVRIRKFSSM